MNSIRAKYAELEKSYRASRNETKQKLSDYKEEADKKLLQLHDKFQSLRSNLHVVRKKYLDVSSKGCESEQFYLT